MNKSNKYKNPYKNIYLGCLYIFIPISILVIIFFLYLNPVINFSKVISREEIEPCIDTCREHDEIYHKVVIDDEYRCSCSDIDGIIHTYIVYREPRRISYNITW